jgi:hypothetical protein
MAINPKVIDFIEDSPKNQERNKKLVKIGMYLIGFGLIWYIFKSIWKMLYYFFGEKAVLASFIFIVLVVSGITYITYSFIIPYFS